MNDNASKLLFVNLFVFSCMFVWMSNLIYALLTSQYIYIYILHMDGDFMFYIYFGLFCSKSPSSS